MANRDHSRRNDREGDRERLELELRTIKSNAIYHCNQNGKGVAGLSSIAFRFVSLDLAWFEWSTIRQIITCICCPTCRCAYMLFFVVAVDWTFHLFLLSR